MKYHLFLDETGDHGLSYIDDNFPLFLLCGCIVESEDLERMEERINDFKLKFFGTTGAILHSRDIRRCEGAFQILFDLQVKKDFYNDLNEILKESNYCLISSAVHKERHIKRYGKSAKNPYSLSLSFILERMIYYLDSISQQSEVEISVEKRGKKEDQQLLAHFNSIMDRGTYHVTSKRFKKKVKEFRSHRKRDNIVGLQVADLCAYPMARHLLNHREPYIPFTVIEQKIYSDKAGKYMGWGLKMFP